MARLTIRRLDGIAVADVTSHLPTAKNMNWTSCSKTTNLASKWPTPLKSPSSRGLSVIAELLVHLQSRRRSSESRSILTHYVMRIMCEFVFAQQVSQFLCSNLIKFHTCLLDGTTVICCMSSPTHLPWELDNQEQRIVAPATHGLQPESQWAAPGQKSSL